MKVGYCVAVQPELASYRLRVAVPAPYIGHPYRIGATGEVTFFYKQGNPTLADKLTGPVVYDVVNDHFKGKYAAEYHAMCGIAATITCASDAMAETVREYTGRDAVVIPDPYENDEAPAAVEGNRLLWFGHSVNIRSVLPYLDDIERTKCEFIVCSDFPKAVVPWSRENEAKCLQEAAVVLLTGGHPGASANRVIKAIRAGRFVVAPGDCAESWREFAPYMHIGDIATGVQWALHHREEACQKVTAGQKYTQEKFAPNLIGAKWMDVFG